MSSGIKGSLGDFVRLSAVSGVGRLRWWFLILIIVALLSAFFAIYRVLREVVMIGPPGVVTAYAQLVLPAAYTEPAPAANTSTAPSQSADVVPAQLKAYVMLGVFAVIALITILSLGVTLFGRDEKRVAGASDTLKTCVGFFIGVATKFF